MFGLGGSRVTIGEVYRRQEMMEKSLHGSLKDIDDRIVELGKDLVPRGEFREAHGALSERVAKIEARDSDLVTFRRVLVAGVITALVSGGVAIIATFAH